MFSVFSDILSTSEKIKALRTQAGWQFDRMLFQGPEDEPLYILKPEAIDLLVWVNSKILYELPKTKNLSEIQWVNVRIRIATNMLNKLVDNGVLTKDIAIEYHRRLTSRIKQILSAIYTEGLPF